MMTHVTGLTCFACGAAYPATSPINLCKCGKPLRVDYDLQAVGTTLTRESLRQRQGGMWRFREVLPLPLNEEPPTLGEGGTPLLLVSRAEERLGLSSGSLWVKDEAVNPTGSFKARGMAAAVAMAAHFGITRLAVPSAGNAGGALAAFAARAGIEAFIFMPKDVPEANILECELAGAHVELVGGLITDCAKIVMDRKAQMGWFDVSTLKEPYRIEGKKTMGYEIAEQLGWTLPDVILYPTGGGTGLVGMWKAFDEMETLGWIDSKRPRMISVQADGCAPIARAWAEGRTHAEPVENAHTVAAGLRVPKAIGDFIMLDILKKSGGTAVTVTDPEMIAAAREFGGLTGISICPEGGACFAALRSLLADGKVTREDRVVVFNTGSAVKYREAFAGTA